MGDHHYVFPPTIPSFQPASFPPSSLFLPLPPTDSFSAPSSGSFSFQPPVDLGDPSHNSLMEVGWETPSRRHTFTAQLPDLHVPPSSASQSLNTGIHFWDLPIEDLDEDEEYQDVSGSESDSEADACIDNVEARHLKTCQRAAWD
jgi:hypothetical protein